MIGRRLNLRAAFNMLRNFINEYPELREGQPWRQAPVRSIQQRNSFNCGVFVTENGRALSAGEDRAGLFNGYVVRRNMAEMFVQCAMSMNPVETFGPREGSTSAQPIRVRQSMSPESRIREANFEHAIRDIMRRRINETPPPDPASTTRTPTCCGQQPSGPSSSSSLFSPPSAALLRSSGLPPAVSPTPVRAPRGAASNLGMVTIQRASPTRRSSRLAPPATPQPPDNSAGRGRGTESPYTGPTTRRMASGPRDQAGRGGSRGR